MNLVDYIKASSVFNKQILESLGANDELINYLLYTPNNTNITIVEQLSKSVLIPLSILPTSLEKSLNAVIADDKRWENIDNQFWFNTKRECDSTIFKNLPKKKFYLNSDKRIEYILNENILFCDKLLIKEYNNSLFYSTTDIINTNKLTNTLQRVSSLILAASSFKATDVIYMELIN